MTELAKRYKSFSGLMWFDIDKMIAKTPEDQLPFLFRKLMWNIQRGTRLSPKSKLGQEFAWIVCNLALACKLDVDAEDIIPNGILNYNDWITHYDLNFAHKIIQDCEHLEKILEYLLTDEGNRILTEDGVNLILVE